MFKNAIIVIFSILLSVQGGYTSGSTQVTQVGEFYSLTLSTPNMNFATDPVTGESGEQSYHANAKKTFEELLAENRLTVVGKVEKLRQVFKGQIQVLAFRPEYPVWNEYMNKQETPKGPVRVNFLVNFPDMGELELVFDKAPSKDFYEKFKGEVRQIFATK